MQRVYDSLGLRPHNICAPRLKLKKKTSRRYSDNLVYQYINKRYEMFQVVQKHPTYIVGHRINLLPFKVRKLTLPWHQVGVFRKGTVDQEQDYILDLTEVDGKCVIAGDVITSCPRNVLFDK